MLLVSLGLLLLIVDQSVLQLGLRQRVRGNTTALITSSYVIIYAVCSLLLLRTASKMKKEVALVRLESKKKGNIGSNIFSGESKNKQTVLRASINPSDFTCSYKRTNLLITNL